jgi:hypothetical protein
MSSWRIFFLSLCLFFVHTISTCAVIPTQQPSSQQPTTRVLSPKKKAKTPSDTEKKNITLPKPKLTEAQKKEQERRLVAEEMNMQRAWMYSAILPGLGQAYNEHYWRIPIIYGVFIGLGWGAYYNHQVYIKHKHKLIEQGFYHGLNNYVDACRQDRDLFIIFAALWYIANIFDAYIGASLKTFDLSNDIGIQFQPSIAPTTQNTPTAGLTLTLSFKK